MEALHASQMFGVIQISFHTAWGASPRHSSGTEIEYSIKHVWMCCSNLYTWKHVITSLSSAFGPIVSVILFYILGNEWEVSNQVDIGTSTMPNMLFSCITERPSRMISAIILLIMYRLGFVHRLVTVGLYCSLA